MRHGFWASGFEVDTSTTRVVHTRNTAPTDTRTRSMKRARQTGCILAAHASSGNDPLDPPTILIVSCLQQSTEPPTPQTPDPRPYTLKEPSDPIPYTLYPTPYALHPRPWTSPLSASTFSHQGLELGGIEVSHRPAPSPQLLLGRSPVPGPLRIQLRVVVLGNELIPRLSWCVQGDRAGGSTRGRAGECAGVKGAVVEGATIGG